MNLRRNILLSLFLAVTQAALSQQEINFTAITIKEGLSSNTVTSVLRDRYGFMWFGTEDGLNKFDGTNFKVYRYKPNDPSKLQTNEILSLHEDRSGNLWIATSGGSLSLYDRKKDAFISIPAGEQPGVIPNNVIMDVCTDFEGKVWVAHYSGVSLVDAATMRVSDVPLSGDPAALRVPAGCVFEDSKHFMWIGTEQGLLQYNPTLQTLVRFVHASEDPGSIAGNDIKSIAEDSDGNIWVGHEAGLSMLRSGSNRFSNHLLDKYYPNNTRSKSIFAVAIDGETLWAATENSLDILNIKTGEHQTYSVEDRNVHSLTARSIRCIYIDKQGICWLGTHGGGVNKYDRNLNLFNLVKSDAYDVNGLNTPVVSAFEEDGNGNVYVGTIGGSGISLFDRKTRLFKHYNIRSARKKADNKVSVLTLTRNKNGQLLFGTYKDGMFIFDPATKNYRQIMQGSGMNDLNSNSVFCIRQDRSGKLWVGTNGNGLNVMDQQFNVIARYTPNPQLPNDRLLPLNGYIRDILEDRQGRIWIATHGGGIAVFTPRNGEFTIYNTRNSKIPNDKIPTLHLDKNGNIWVGTFGNGVAMLNPQTNQFTCFSEANGLQNNSVYKILEDKEGHIWVSTNKAISSIDINTKKIHNYGPHNGVQNNNFVGGSGLAMSTGEIFFGGHEGFNYINPSYLKRTTTVPTVLLTDLRVSNQSVIPSAKGPIKENITIAREIDLDYKQNFVLSFVGLNYTSPEQNQYAYRLEGFDKDWNYVGQATSASYTNLDPGSYVFRVKACNNEGVWNNETASIKIYVHPPFWRTTFAYFMYAVIAIGLVLYLRYRSIQKWKKKFRLEQEQKEAERIHELDQLKIKFLTNLSHEFRTPISLILGPVDTLLTQQNNKSQGQLYMIKRNAKRLLNLVNQLLDFRKMEEHELTLQKTEGELVSFVKEASDSFRDLSEKKKIGFVFHSDIDQLHTSFDHDKIERIIFNLLSNAFKFTLPGGQISLEIAKMETPPDTSGNWITMRISDSGIGIPADKKEKIFDRFFQHATATSILNQGTGIGLSITKEFIEMHGGKIELESEEGKGSSFLVHLPFAPTVSTLNGKTVSTQETEMLEIKPRRDEPVQKTNGIHASNGNGEMPLVLLVEDNEDFRLYLKENLRMNYKVAEAADGREGWQKALSLHPQLIVSDISMPHMNGIELTKKIKSDKRTTHIPVILLTALTGEEEQIRGLETGANDYVTKPFNFGVLNAKIHNLLVLNDTLKNAYSKQIKILPSEVKIESDDEKLLNTIMAYLEENLTNSQLSVEDLSRHVGMSRSSLYNRILEITGKTPVEFIRGVKLEKAAVLLEKSDMNVAQIAYSTGFSTPHYFTKSFKAKFDMLPSEFMTKMRKKNGNGNGEGKQ